jgi:protein gp37
MGITTAIEYCDSSVNPVMGCTGCELWHRDPDKSHCYAAALCNRYGGGNNKGWPADFHHPEHFPGRLEKAIRWPDLTGADRPGKPWLNGLPRIIFVNDLGDGFCPTAPDPWQWLAPHIMAMASSPHIYLLLTKWPGCMAGFFAARSRVPPNFILGTTITSQDTARRLQVLFELAFQSGPLNLWVSCEPLLGPVDLSEPCLEELSYDFPDTVSLLRDNGHTLWIAAGGESGRNARPWHPDWALLLRDQCLRAGVPFFWKQNGEWLPAETPEGAGTYARVSPDGKLMTDERHRSIAFSSVVRDWGWYLVNRVGKKRAGRLLRGEEWSQMPALPWKGA